MTSGFSVVARKLSEPLKLPWRTLLDQLLVIEQEHGRGRVFDILIETHEPSLRPMVPALVQLYRTHNPRIHLHPSAPAILNWCNRNSMGGTFVITDGNRMVQRRKVQALGLPPLVSKILFTRDYGIESEKPSTLCFEKVLKKSGCRPENLVYVGDDPSKDFDAVKYLGGTAIRVLQGRHKETPNKPESHPNYVVASLAEVKELLSNLPLLPRKRPLDSLHTSHP